MGKEWVWVNERGRKEWMKWVGMGATERVSKKKREETWQGKWEILHWCTSFWCLAIRQDSYAISVSWIEKWPFCPIRSNFQVTKLYIPILNIRFQSKNICLFVCVWVKIYMLISLCESKSICVHKYTWDLKLILLCLFMCNALYIVLYYMHLVWNIYFVKASPV